MNKSSTLLLTTILLATTFLQSAAQADNAARGLEIAIEADRRDTGFTDQVAEMTMTLKNSQGQTSTREVRVKTLEVNGDGDKSMSIFDTPADIKGTASLTYSHALQPDEQWLYLPALKRVKRINSKNKSGPFMGSEFAYEDISSQEVEKYSYKYLRDEVLNGIDCYVIERYPEYTHSGYTRQLVWVNKQEYRPEQIVFFDRKNVKLKTLTYAGYNQYLNQFWRADKMTMINHQTGKETTLEWRNYKFKSGLSDDDFNRNSLKRAR